MNVRWWKMAKSLVGTPAGEQTGLLPSTWQVRSIIGDFCSCLIVLLAILTFVTALEDGSFKRPLWLKPWIISCSADKHYLTELPKQALWLIQVENDLGGDQKMLIPFYCHMSMQPSLNPTNV